MEKTLGQIPSNCLKIVLFGPESSGKTTLAEQLAAHYNTRWVSEFMREYLQEKWDSKKEKVRRDDLLPIARGQMILENNAAKESNTFLFCDTDLLELKVYSQYYYDGFCPAEILKACSNNHYDHYFLTHIDTPWEVDDLRDRPYEREKLFRIFEKELQQNKIPYTLLKGDEKERLEKATQVLTTLKIN
jgi:NadR type nicotinamide-nucleotide adenylyltransferase